MQEDTAFAEVLGPVPSLAGKSVLIFGGTSGIGLATAVAAKASGAAVIVAGRDRDRVAHVADAHGFAGSLAAEISDPEAIRQGLSPIERVDHLVLLAGALTIGKVMEADVSLLQRAYDERIWSVVHILRTLGERLAADASITLVSGALTHHPDGNGTAIVASACAALEVLARGLALELAPRRVNTLSPGPIDTPLIGKAMGDQRDAYMRMVAESHPLHRWGSADEAAAAVLFLMANRYMNGAVLHVDGGSRL
ncbi:MAG TPA: SDR family oxidoreductase [Gammaproteobacteria bacterium]